MQWRPSFENSHCGLFAPLILTPLERATNILFLFFRNGVLLWGYFLGSASCIQTSSRRKYLLIRGDEGRRSSFFKFTQLEDAENISENTFRFTQTSMRRKERFN